VRSSQVLTSRHQSTADLFYAVDGATIVNLRRHPFAPNGKLGRAIWKGGIYLRKGLEDLANGQPTQRAIYDRYRQYEGVPRAENLGPLVTPFTPVQVKVGQGEAMPMLPQVGASVPAEPVPEPQAPSGSGSQAPDKLSTEDPLLVAAKANLAAWEAAKDTAVTQIRAQKRLIKGLGKWQIKA
jgi:hypothetical protein